MPPGKSVRRPDDESEEQNTKERHGKHKREFMTLVQVQKKTEDTRKLQ